MPQFEVLYGRERGARSIGGTIRKEGARAEQDEFVELVKKHYLARVERQDTADAYLSCQVVHKSRVEVWTCYVGLSLSPQLLVECTVKEVIPIQLNFPEVA